MPGKELSTDILVLVGLDELQLFRKHTYHICIPHQSSYVFIPGDWIVRIDDAAIDYIYWKISKSISVFICSTKPSKGLLPNQLK